MMLTFQGAMGPQGEFRLFVSNMWMLSVAWAIEQLRCDRLGAVQSRSRARCTLNGTP